MIKGWIKNRGNKKGFTLLEMVVSLGIMMMISTILLQQENFSVRSKGLKVSVRELTSNLRKAQSFSLSLKKFRGGNVFPSGGWGIRFRNGLTYEIFADLNNDRIYTDNEKYLSVNYSGGVRMVGVKIDSVVTAVGEVVVSFEPPDPIIHMCPDVAPCAINNMEIILQNATGRKSSIFINKFGLVEDR